MEKIRDLEVVICCFYLYRSHRYEDCGKDQVYHDANPEIYHRHVKLIGTLRSITQGKNKTSEKGGKISPLEDYP